MTQFVQTQRERYVNGKTAAEFLGLTPQGLGRLRIIGAVPAHRIPGRGQYRYLLSEVQAALEPVNAEGRR